MAIVSQTIVTSAISTNFKKAIMMILRNADFFVLISENKGKKGACFTIDPKRYFVDASTELKGCTKDKWNLG